MFLALKLKSFKLNSIKLVKHLIFLEVPPSPNHNNTVELP